MDGYKVLMKKFIASLPVTLTPAEKREVLEGWKEGYWAAQQSHDPRPYEGKEDVFIVSGGNFDVGRGKLSTGKVHQFTGLSPKEASPQYRDQGEPRYSEADYIGVIQHPVTLDPSIAERPQGEPDFSSDKYRGHRFDLEVLEFTYGFDSKTNQWVLYSPIDHNRKKLSPRSRVLILRSIGMAPKKIAMVESLKYGTIMHWLEDLSGFPLLPATAHDWATGYNEHGVRQVFNKRSPLNARHIKPIDSGSSEGSNDSFDYDNRVFSDGDKVDMLPDKLVSYRTEERGSVPFKSGLTNSEVVFVEKLKRMRKS